MKEQGTAMLSIICIVPMLVFTFIFLFRKTNGLKMRNECSENHEQIINQTLSRIINGELKNKIEDEIKKQTTKYVEHYIKAQISGLSIKQEISYCIQQSVLDAAQEFSNKITSPLTGVKDVSDLIKKNNAIIEKQEKIINELSIKYENLVQSLILTNLKELNVVESINKMIKMPKIGEK